MKKFLFIFFAGAVLQAQAQQVTNGGFESGWGHIPDNWFIDQEVGRATTVNRAHNGNNYSITAHGGQFFLRLSTTQEINGPDTTVNLGYASLTMPAVGHPDSLVFNMIYFPEIPEDHFVVTLAFLKWDSASMDMVPVMSTSTNGNGPSSSTWGRRSLGIFYFNGNKPAYDSLQIVIQSANPGQHVPGTFDGLWGIGTTLLIDDITLISGTTGITKIDIAPGINVYPNPAVSSATIAYTLNAASTVSICVYDINGREVLKPFSATQQAGDHEQVIDISAFSNGVYFYKLATESSVETGKFIVNR